MNNIKGSASIASKLRPDHPHASVIVWFISRDEPLNKSARIVLTIACEGKKKTNTCNHHSLHTRNVGVNLNENRVMPSILIPPVWVGANAFPVHTASTTEVTRCKKTGNR
jgi:hypothetical protein